MKTKQTKHGIKFELSTVRYMGGFECMAFAVERGERSDEIACERAATAEEATRKASAKLAGYSRAELARRLASPYCHRRFTLMAEVLHDQVFSDLDSGEGSVLEAFEVLGIRAV